MPADECCTGLILRRWGPHPSSRHVVRSTRLNQYDNLTPAPPGVLKTQQHVLCTPHRAALPNTYARPSEGFFSPGPLRHSWKVTSPADDPSGNCGRRTTHERSFVCGHLFEYSWLFPRQRCSVIHHLQTQLGCVGLPGLTLGGGVHLVIRASSSAQTQTSGEEILPRSANGSQFSSLGRLSCSVNSSNY